MQTLDWVCTTITTDLFCVWRGVGGRPCFDGAPLCVSSSSAFAHVLQVRCRVRAKRSQLIVRRQPWYGSGSSCCIATVAIQRISIVGKVLPMVTAWEPLSAPDAVRVKTIPWFLPPLLGQHSPSVHIPQVMYKVCCQLTRSRGLTPHP